MLRFYERLMRVAFLMPVRVKNNTFYDSHSPRLTNCMQNKIWNQRLFGKNVCTRTFLPFIIESAESIKSKTHKNIAIHCDSAIIEFHIQRNQCGVFVIVCGCAAWRGRQASLFDEFSVFLLRIKIIYSLNIRSHKQMVTAWMNFRLNSLAAKRADGASSKKLMPWVANLLWFPVDLNS